jgi:hypothetical protein
MRLLRIRPAVHNRVVLEEYTPTDERPKYVSMSHCWDNFSETKFLSRSNIGRLRSGVSMKELPQKFQDAIEIARWMEVDYIWIDAFCIMQDSSEDWNQQSKYMGDIYAGSVCNIAALNEGMKSSCFGRRPVDVVEPFCVPNPGWSSSVASHIIGYDDFWCNSLLDAKLHTRAWVLQERLLAPRTVHFGKEQIYWECRVHKACEAYPHGLPQQFTNHRTKAWREGDQIINPSTITISRDAAKDGAESITRRHGPGASLLADQVKALWSQITENYMDCNMSVASDKLVAIAGLARKMQQTSKASYLAGHWNDESLALSLLWFVPAAKQTDGRQSFRHPSHGASGYRAPSWSWASIDATITWIWPSTCDEELVHITGAYATPAGDNPFGAVSSGRIFAKGLLFPVNVRVANRHEDGKLNEDGAYILTSRQEQPATSGNGSDFHHAAAELQPSICPDQHLDTAHEIEAYVLPICRNWRGSTGRIIAHVAGLLVRRALSGQAATYERFGMVELDEDEVGALCGHEPISSRSIATEFELL